MYSVDEYVYSDETGGTRLAFCRTRTRVVSRHQPEGGCPMLRRERDRFDRFTERARKVLSLAQEESQRFQHNYIGTEHLLLGLVREDEGVAAKVLQALGVNVNAARSAVEEMVGRGDRIVLGEISLTPHAKKVIELAVVEAQLLKHHYVGTEHMLLGLLRVPEGRGVQILRKLGVEESAVRTQTLQLLSQQPPQPERIDEARQARGGFIGRRERGRFDRLGDDAWRVLALAQEEAQHFQHNYIGTEHLLLGLVRSEESTAGQVLRRLGLELQKVRNSVEFIIGHGDSIVLSEIGLTPRSKKVIELAVDEARLLQHNYVGSEHLLLGLIREGQGIAAGVLESLGVKLERVRMTVLEVLGKGQGLLDLAGAYVRGEKALEPLFSGVQDADDLVPEPASVEEHGNRFTIRARRVLVGAFAGAQQDRQGGV